MAAAHRVWWSPRFWLERIWLLLLFLALRAADLVLLLVRPRLLPAYLRIWWAEARDPPYYRAYSFDTVMAAGAAGLERAELSYGETPLATGIWLFRRAGVGRGSLLLDLGAGRGRALLAARWLGAEARGIELVSRHVQRARPALASAGIDLVEQSSFDADLTGATHVFLAWGACDRATCDRLAERLSSVTPGVRIIAVDREIRDDALPEVMRCRGLFTWGVSPVWIYERTQ